MSLQADEQPDRDERSQLTRDFELAWVAGLVGHSVLVGSQFERVSLHFADADDAGVVTARITLRNGGRYEVIVKEAGDEHTSS